MATMIEHETPEQEDVVLEVRNITKQFPGVLANDDVSFKLRRGEIMALLGENGAGKSTLMNVIYGLYHQDEGEVLLKGKEVRFSNPREAIHSGIGMVHQHFQLVDVMNVAENVVLGEEKETPKLRTIFATIFLLLVGLLIGFQLTYEQSPLLDLLGTDRWADSQMLIFDTVLYLVAGFGVPLFIASWLARLSRNIIAPFVTFILLVLPAFVLMVLTVSDSSAAVVWSGVGVLATMAGLLYVVSRLRQSSSEDRSALASHLWTRFTIALAAIYTTIFMLAQHDLSSLIEFVVPLAIGVALSAGLAAFVARGLTALFDRWDTAAAFLRVSWGMAWRLGLILGLIWLGGMIFDVTQMGMMTAILQSDPETTETIDISTNARAFSNADQTGYKAALIRQPSFSVSWNRIGRTADEVGSPIDALHAEVQAAFQQPEEVTLQPQNGIGGRVITYNWSGLDPAFLDAVDSVPPVVRDALVSLLLILAGVVSLRTWRGWQRFPDRLVQLDYILIALIAIAYVAALILVPDALNSLVHLLFVVAGAVILTFTIYQTGRNRERHQDQIQPIFPLDTAIDAFTTTVYDTASVRDTREAAERVRSLSRAYNLEVNPDAYIEKLPVGLQQRVEIIKALYRQADILILDEPTAVLTPQEGKELFRIMRELASEGVSIIFITHKLKEVFEVANRIVVMRGGRVVGSTTPDEATEGSLAEMMVGREVLLQVDKDEAKIGEPVLRVHDLSATDDRGAPALKDVSFDVYAGEVLGIAGVQGNGQSELVEVLTGLRQPDRGGIELMNVDLRPETPPPASPTKHLLAAVIDLAINGLLTLFAASFISYLGSGPGEYEIISWASLITFLVIDAVATVLPWQNQGMTLGMLAAGIQIDPNRRSSAFELRWGEGGFALNIGGNIIGSEMLFDGRQTSRFQFELLFRYIIYTLMRLSVVGYVLSLIEMQSSPAQEMWFDRLLNFRVIQRETVTPRKIKNLQASHVPEDRLRFAMVRDFTVAENLVLNDYYQQPYAEAPTTLQAVPLGSVYGLTFAAIFAAFAYSWVYLWENGFWQDILDRYEVPRALRSVPTDRALSGTQSLYMEDPLMVALLSLLVTVVVFGILAHFGARFVAGIVRQQFNQSTRRGGLNLNMQGAVAHANDLISEYDIRTPSALTDVGSLSGGNQQKLVVAREFSREPRLLIASQPTRGIDVGSIEFIHRQIIQQRDQGAAVLLVSAELDEVMSLSDRIAVMYQGEIIDVLPAESATREQLGLLMAGIKN